MGSTPVCLCPDSLPERPLGLWSAVLELLSAKQPSQLECTSRVETLPYKALGTVASANFFFCKTSQSLGPTPPLVRRSGLSAAFFWIFFATLQCRKSPRISVCKCHTLLCIYVLFVFSVFLFLFMKDINNQECCFVSKYSKISVSGK